MFTRIVFPLLAVAAVAGCSGSGSSGGATTPTRSVAATTAPATTAPATSAPPTTASVTYRAGSPTVAAPVVSGTAAGPSSRYAFVPTVNTSYEQIEGFAIDPSGALSSVGLPATFSLTYGGHVLGMDPQGRFLVFATDDITNGSQTVVSCPIDLTTGGLSIGMPVTLANSAQLSGPVDVAFSPAGTSVYVSLHDGSIAAFQVTSTLDVSQVGARAPTGTIVSNLAVEPSGRFLYASTQGVSVFAIDPSGALTAAGVVPLPGGATCTMVRASGAFLYALSNVGDVVTFAIDPTTGALSQVSTTSMPGTGDIRIVPGMLLTTTFDVASTGFASGTETLRSFALDSTTGVVGAAIGSYPGLDVTGVPTLDASGSFLYALEWSSGVLTTLGLVQGQFVAVGASVPVANMVGNLVVTP